MEIVTFEIAKKIKGKSFPQKTAGRYSMIDCFYYEDGRLFFHGGACDVNEAYTAPTISQVLKWLREEKKIFIAINIAWCYEDENKPFYKNPKMLPILKGYNAGIYNLDNLNDGKMSNKITYFETYEEAALAGIEYVLDNLI